MAHWPHDIEREDGDAHDETAKSVIRARKWLRRVADNSRSPLVRDLMSELRSLEQSARGHFLGLDHDTEDRDDVDEMGPY
jgi:hypothetical protein